jgi:hypothetical protein
MYEGQFLIIFGRMFEQNWIEEGERLEEEKKRKRKRMLRREWFKLYK